MSTITSEKFFYIMDYSSHYYRVDAKDQLVAAGSEDEATIFTFADANRRIGAGLKSRFYFMTPVASDEGTEDERAANRDYPDVRHAEKRPQHEKTRRDAPDYHRGIRGLGPGHERTHDAAEDAPSVHWKSRQEIEEP